MKIFVSAEEMRTPEDAARWLLTFARTDLTDPASRAAAARRLRTFLASGHFNPLTHMIATQVAGLPGVSLEERDVLNLQHLARRGLAKLRNGKSWELPARLRYRLAAQPGRNFKGLIAFEPLGPLADRFNERCAAVLAAVGSRIARCGCGEFFLPVKRQRYCSEACFESARRDYNREAKRRQRERDRARVRRQNREA